MLFVWRHEEDWREECRGIRIDPVFPDIWEECSHLCLERNHKEQGYGTVQPISILPLGGIIAHETTRNSDPREQLHQTVWREGLLLFGGCFRVHHGSNCKGSVIYWKDD